MPTTHPGPPAQGTPSYPRIVPAPAADWLQVPRLLLTLAGLKLRRAWQAKPDAPRLSRRQVMVEWEF